jgi:uncharacterized protein with von Willebrand factor type A (vWA) domain
VSIVLLVDRSLALPDNPEELYDVRGCLVAELSRRLGSELDTCIAFSDVASVTSMAEAQEAGPDFVYGSNLQHALLLARAACRSATSNQIILLTYSLPSAHHVQGRPFFMDPPIAESLEAARTEAQCCAADGIRVNTMLIVENAHPDRSLALEAFFRPITEATGGTLVSFQADEDFTVLVDRFLLGHSA